MRMTTRWNPDETQQLLGVAHAIRDTFGDWKERFCVLKAMIKALAQVQSKGGTLGTEQGVRPALYHAV